MLSAISIFLMVKIVKSELLLYSLMLCILLYSVKTVVHFRILLKGLLSFLVVQTSNPKYQKQKME